MVHSSLMANTEGYRLVRCPKCLNILPEPPNVTVYECGGCGTTLRAKIRATNGQHVAKKQVRQDSDNYSVATAVSNGAPPQTKDHASTEITMDTSCITEAPSTEHDSNGTRSNQSGEVTLPEKNDMEVENNESKDHNSFEGQDTNSKMEGSADLENSNANSTCQNSSEAENHVMEQPADNSETCRVREDDDTDCHLNSSGNNMFSSEMSKADVNTQDAEQKEAGQSEHAANKKSYLVRVLSRSCDLRASGNSLDFHSARTSLQSKSFRASEPLQSKIMNTVDELKGDLSELFHKPSEPKPKQPYAYPPRPSKQDGHMTRAAITSSAPLAAYHPAAKHSGYAARISRSGQVVPPRGLPSLRYRRHRVYPCHHHSVQMEMMRPCRHECCHSCQPPPCYRSCKLQEPLAAAMQAAPATKEIVKRRPPPRNHCRPVLGGAPFVVCSNCVRLVQLPTDFAVPSRGTRRLQCGACSETLSYSYRDPSRKRPPPQSPFGGDEYSSDGGYENHHQDDRYGGGYEQADPVSYSEEYGLSFGVGDETSTEDGRPLYVSRNSSFNTVDGIAVSGRDGKLHRLMGYSSASELLRHSPDLFESFHGRTPSNARAPVVDRKGKGVVCVAEGDGRREGERDGGAAVKKRPSKARSGGLVPLQGILKKGIHGLESLKLRS